MKRNMILVCVAVVCLTLVGGTLMANDSAFRSPNQPAYDPGPIYSFEQIQYSANFSTLQDVSAYVVTTSTDATQVVGRISDCCVPGDFYRLGIIARRNEAGFSTDFVVDGTSNNCDANPDFAVTPCAADVYGPDCVVTPAFGSGRGRIQAAAIAMFANDAPGGLGASGFVQLETDGTFQGEFGPFEG